MLNKEVNKAMAKPSKSYLELMEKLKQNEATEQRVMAESAMEKQREYSDRANSYMMEVNSNMHKKEKAMKEFGRFQTEFKSEILESVLATIVHKSLPTVINEEGIVSAVLNEFIATEGVYKILDNMSSKTQLLSEIADEIEDAYDDGVESIDKEEPDTFSANKAAATDLISKVEGDETIDDLTDVIRAKVSRATDEFIEKNVMDQTEIKSTLQDAKLRMDSVRTGDDALDEEIRQEHTNMAKRKVHEIRQRNHTVFEQLVMNITESVLKSDLKDQYIKEDGSLNMDKIVEKATCIYTVMETLNTMKIKDFNEQDIQNMIQFD